MSWTTPRSAGRILLSSGFLLLACPGGPASEETIPQQQSGGSGSRRTDCPLPPDLASVTGHVLVRATADETGKVLFVKDLYSTLHPPEKRKPVVKALTGCLQKRLFPEVAMEGGWKVRTNLLLAFHYFRPVADDAPRVQVSGGRRVPIAWLDEMRDEKVRLAGSLLGKSSRREVTGPGWVLHTDLPSPVIADLEASLAFAARSFDLLFPGLPPVPETAPVTIWVFRDEERFNQVAAFDNLDRIPGALAGAYRPRDRMIYTYATTSITPPAVIAGTVAHEATHHLVSQRLYAGGRVPPFWVSEGIASLIECLDSGSADPIEFSRFVRGKMYKGAWQWKAPAEGLIDAIETSERRHDLEQLRALLAGGDWRMPVDMAYGLSWLLVHYLVNADEGRLRPGFVTWMAGPEGESDDAATLAAALGMTREDLELALRAHMKKIL